MKNNYRVALHEERNQCATTTTKKNQVAVDLYASIESCNRFNTDAREKIRLFNEEHLQFIY